MFISSHYGFDHLELRDKTITKTPSDVKRVTKPKLLTPKLLRISSCARKACFGSSVTVKIEYSIVSIMA